MIKRRAMTYKSPAPCDMERESGLTSIVESDFFTIGTDTTCVSECANCCCDLKRFACSPSACTSPANNALAMALKNCFCGASKGIWYRHCGCCCPLKSIDFVCFCCKGPEERCESMAFWGARTLWSGTGTQAEP